MKPSMDLFSVASIQYLVFISQSEAGDIAAFNGRSCFALLRIVFRNISYRGEQEKEKQMKKDPLAQRLYTVGKQRFSLILSKKHLLRSYRKVALKPFG